MLTVLLHRPQWDIQSFSKDFDMTVPALLQTIGYNTFFSQKPASTQDLYIAHAPPSSIKSAQIGKIVRLFRNILFKM